jgi:ribose 5-phosphate isomerase B
MKIAIGTDHAGFEFKEGMKKFLKSQGHKVLDLGTHSLKRCDYPDYALKVARAVVEKKVAQGVLVCGAGIGMSVAANKVPGIRAALCHDLYTARMSRAHNNANILVLPARIVAPTLGEEIAKVYLSTRFEGGRHRGRLEKIRQIEKMYSR